jgi:hypothetical protein
MKSAYKVIRLACAPSEFDTLARSSQEEVTR